MSLIATALGFAKLFPLSPEPTKAKSELSLATTVLAISGGKVTLLECKVAGKARFLLKATDGRSTVRGYGPTPQAALDDAVRQAPA